MSNPKPLNDPYEQGFAVVLLDLALDKPLDYAIPKELSHVVQPGMRVEVPVRGQLSSGFVIEVKANSAWTKAKPIHRILSSVEVISPELFRLALWMARYYCTPLRQVLKIMTPVAIRSEQKFREQQFVSRAKTREELQSLCADLRRKAPAQAGVLDLILPVKKGLFLSEILEKNGNSRSSIEALVKKGYLKVERVQVDRSPLIGEEYIATKPKILNEAQASVFKKICASLKEKRFETHLLHGITGSGKTEVYLQAIEHVLSLGCGAIMLVPEIALTAQTIEQFRSRFSHLIAVLHHRLSEGERHDEWHRVYRGEARIVVGARSAIFSPVKHLGLIIIDEEHDHAYKQSEEMPCYHARDVAVIRAQQINATVILGSATPSLESYYNAKKGKYLLGELSTRTDAATLPAIKIIDMRKEYEKAQGFTNFSEALLEGIKERIDLGEQTILFLNRRGYHTSLLCQHCGKTVKCNHCDSSLTFHRSEESLSCHLCGFAMAPPPRVCPSCAHPDPLKFKGVGTEQIEKALHALFPQVRTLRIDADTTRHKGSHQRLFRAFATGKADVLIGTQMIAKGLHFPAVTLVGIINSDASLNFPDFRASETTFQLITQVAGRAGRGAMAGEVVIQTSLPENATIQSAAKQDYREFYNTEMGVREFFHYPPYGQIVKLFFSGKEEEVVRSSAEKMRSQLLMKLSHQYTLQPVIPSGHSKVKDQYRFQFLIQGPKIYPMTEAIAATVEESGGHTSKVRFRIDVNPTSTFL